MIRRPWLAVCGVDTYSYMMAGTFDRCVSPYKDFLNGNATCIADFLHPCRGIYCASSYSGHAAQKRERIVALLGLLRGLATSRAEGIGELFN